MKKKVNALVRQRANKPDLEKIASFDLESRGLGGDFILAAVKFCDQDEYFHFWDTTSMLQFMLEHADYTFFAHNFSGYEATYLVEDFLQLQKEGWTIEFTQQGKQRIIAAEITKDKIKLRLWDSLPLFNMPLKTKDDRPSVIKAFCPHLEEMTLEFDEGHVFDPENEVDINYLHQDVNALNEALIAFRKQAFAEFHCKVGLTAGSTAMKAWLASIEQGKAYFRLNKKAEEFCRKAYYGGYVFPGHTFVEHENVISIDANAMYGAQMLKQFPVGSPIYSTEYVAEYAGIWHVKVTTPAVVPFPIVPVKTEHGLLWPTGTFFTYITREEIEFARKREYEIEVISGYYWENVEYMFETFIKKCEQMELNVLTKPLAKLMRNSLYGKFGTREEASIVVLSSEDIINSTTLRPYETPDGSFVDGLYVGLEKNDALYILPHIAAYITAFARITLFLAIEAVGSEHVHYSDTDSVKADALAVQEAIDNNRLDIGKQYGSWKVDEVYETFICRGPKNYSGKINGKIKARIKGIRNYNFVVDDATGSKHKVKTLTEEVLQLATAKLRPDVTFFRLNSPLSRLKDVKKPIATTAHRRIGTFDQSAGWKLEGDNIVPTHLEQS